MLLRNHCGVDFSLYKPSTIQRRIARRIILTRQETLAGYAGFLRDNAQELDSLFSDVLISVTSFFRNPEMFEALQRDVLPKLLAQRNDDPVRCWMLGCSTGQEAYSLAISLMEAARNAPHQRKLQIFATDLNETLLEKARQGLYTKALTEDLSPERLRQFFVEEEGGYRINKAKQENKTVRAEHVRVTRDGVTSKIHVEVIPLKNLRERCFLISFEDADKQGRAAALPPARLQPAARPLSAQQESDRIAELESDLAETRDYVQAMQEQHEAANEELQASGEEVQSANEELQSINEELETSKEELESANEELTTVNEEMSNRNGELNRLNNDLVNLQNSAKIAIVLLGRNLIIRRFSPQAEKQFDLLASDLGRSIGKIRHGLVSSGPAGSLIDLAALSANVIGEVREQEQDVRDKDSRWYQLRVRLYITLDNKVDGAVLVDITDLKRSEQAVIQALDSAQNTIETMPLPLLVLDKELRAERANRAFYRTFLVEPAETLGRFIYDLGNRQWDIARLRQLLEEILPQNMLIENFEVEHNFEQLGFRTMLLNAVCNLHPVQKLDRILLTIADITELKQTEAARDSLAAIVEGSADSIIGEDLDGIITSLNGGASGFMAIRSRKP